MPTIEAPKTNTNDIQARNGQEDPASPPEDIVDQATFDQILEMDDDEDREFSRAIVFGFFDQAKETFQQMEELVKARDLNKLSSLGHFLKGSSATLGLTKVQDSCEKIQHLGAKKDESGTKDLTDEVLCLKKIKETLGIMKQDYRQAEEHLTKFYSEETSSP